MRCENLLIPYSYKTQMNVEGIRLKNIKVQQNALLHKIFNLASNPSYDSTQIQQLNKILITTEHFEIGRAHV